MNLDNKTIYHLTAPLYHLRHFLSFRKLGLLVTYVVGIGKGRHYWKSEGREIHDSFPLKELYSLRS
jgi:hypothetical protein